MNVLLANGVGIVILILMLVFIAIWIWAWLPHNRRTFDALARMPMQDSPAAADEPASDGSRS